MMSSIQTEQELRQFLEKRRRHLIREVNDMSRILGLSPVVQLSPETERLLVRILRRKRIHSSPEVRAPL